MVTPSISIVVPVFNERQNAPQVITEVRDWAKVSLDRFEIVVVDDGSSDGSIEAIEAALPSEPALRIVRHPRNQGLTAALRTGFTAAALELVTWVPADGQIRPQAIGTLLAAWRGEAMVISSYDHRPDGLWRLVMSRTSRLMLRAIIGFRGRLEGIYLFQRKLLDEISLVSSRSAGIVAFELAAKIQRRGLPIAETQIDCLPRRSGRSKVADARNILGFVAELWVIRGSMSR